MSDFYPNVKPPLIASKCHSVPEMKKHLRLIDWDVWFQEIIKLDSSPGYPYTLLGKTNKAVLDNYRDVIIDLVIDRFVKLVVTPLETIKTMSHVDLMDSNYVDPVRLFVKQEPHPSRKFLAGKMRLISSVSLVDQLVERIFHSMINNKFIGCWKLIPSKPGIGLTTDADFSAIVDQFTAIKNPCSSDIQGWDWSVQYDELMFIADFRALVYQLDFDHPFICGMRNRQHLVANSIYGLSDGVLFSSETEIGMQLSGCYITSSGNSEMRIANTVLAQAIGMARQKYKPLDDEKIMTVGIAVEIFKSDPKSFLKQFKTLAAMAMGDDCLEEYNFYISLIYEYLGHPVKFVDIFNPFEDMSFEFCSNRIELSSNYNYLRHYPSNVGKSLFNLIHQPVSRRTREILDTFLLSIRHHPDRDEIIEYLRTTEWKDLINLIYALPVTQSCLSEMTRKGSKKIVVDALGNQEVLVTRKKSTTAHPPQKDTTVVEYVTPYVKHVKLGNTKTTKVVHKSPKSSGSGTNPISRKVSYGRESFKMSGIQHGIRIRGRSIVSQLITHQISPLAQLNTCILMHPSAMNSVQLDRMSSLYQKYKFKKFNIEVVSQLPTTATGMIFGAIYPTNDIVPPLESLGLKKYLQANPTFKETNVYNTLHLNMPNSKYLPSYTMEFNNSDTSIQGVAYLGSQYAQTEEYIADIIVTYDLELYNMTAPSVITGTPQQVVVDFPGGSYGGLYRTDASEPFHPTGVYQMVCQLSAPFAGNPTRNGPNLGSNTQVLWYIVQKIAASAWSHSWAYTYEQAVQGEQITFPSNVSVTTTSRVRMFGNLVRRFGVNAEQPYNMLETKIQQVSDNIKQSEYDKQYRDWETDRKSTRLNSSHSGESRMPSSA